MKNNKGANAPLFFTIKNGKTECKDRAKTLLFSQSRRLTPTVISEISPFLANSLIVLI